MLKNTKIIKNPFAEKCENCTTDMWEYLKNKHEKSHRKKITIKIEKFKDDS